MMRRDAASVGARWSSTGSSRTSILSRSAAATTMQTPVRPPLLSAGGTRMPKGDCAHVELPIISDAAGRRHITRDKERLKEAWGMGSAPTRTERVRWQTGEEVWAAERQQDVVLQLSIAFQDGRGLGAMPSPP